MLLLTFGVLIAYAKQGVSSAAPACLLGLSFVYASLLGLALVAIDGVFSAATFELKEKES